MITEKILYVDVQASGFPGNGFLLELAWKRPGSSAHCFLVRNTCGKKIPDRVRRITGITDEDVNGADALHPDEVRKLFLAAAGMDGEGSPLVLVAHFAVYEKRWLDWLTGLDLSFICTRELARKKITGLPSGTLRSVAGAAGFSLGEKRRASDHVYATEAVFIALQSGFEPVSISRKRRLSFPECPGVYRFWGSSDDLLYIGKAKNLRKRVNSHFTGRQKGRHSELIARTCRVTYEEKATALDAALMESRLIFEFSPQYNLAGRSSSEALWYISCSMDKLSTEPDDTCFYGPFSTRHPMAEFLELSLFIEKEYTKMTFVENLWPEVPETLLNQALSEWEVLTGKDSVLYSGLRLHLLHGKSVGNEQDRVDQPVDVEYVKKKLDDLIAYGCLQCRKAAVHRLLQGCEIRWNGTTSRGHVYKFVENAVTNPWNRRKLQITRVLLAEIRRIYREGKEPEIRTRFDTVIKGDSLGYLLSVV
ncbi:MAG: GIY-YIG nuclease family protein [Candidatus Sabulitectum sp.]|nr:GIY-YIG nuclease family protein [Candidatus Sabulitectum sp.]